MITIVPGKLKLRPIQGGEKIYEKKKHTAVVSNNNRTDRMKGE